MVSTTKSLILLLLIASLLVNVSALTTYTYSITTQENPTSYSCTSTGDMQWDSVQTCALAHDGDWDTYGTAEVGNTSSLFVNYTKPTDYYAINWSIKSDIDTTFADATLIPEGCLNLPYVAFEIRVNDTTPIYYLCYNGTDWLDMFNTPTAEDFYEESVNWTIRTATVTHPIDEQLAETGDGLGDLFDATAEPLGNFLIIIGMASGIIALFIAIVYRVKTGL